MDIQATCGCGAKITLAPGSPASLGNSHGYAANNNGTVDAEREAVAAAFALWADRHSACGRPPPPVNPISDEGKI
jgi:hypothetical protein